MCMYIYIYIYIYIYTYTHTHTYQQYIMSNVSKTIPKYIQVCTKPQQIQHLDSQSCGFMCLPDLNTAASPAASRGRGTCSDKKDTRRTTSFSARIELSEKCQTSIGDNLYIGRLHPGTLGFVVAQSPAASRGRGIWPEFFFLLILSLLLSLLCDQVLLLIIQSIKSCCYELYSLQVILT